MNEHAFAQLDDFGIHYASDGRAALADDGSLLDPASGPYRLRTSRGEMDCMQMPTTLPTLDELLGREINGTVVDTSSIADAILRLTESPRDHVFTLHAELEGQKLAPIFEQLLKGWQAQGYELASMADYFERIKTLPLPAAPLEWGSVPGRSGELILHSAR
jgi:hypothetical protein